MTSRPPSKLKQLLLRDQLWWRYYQRNADTIRPAVVDAISKVLACGRVIMGYASLYAATMNALTPKERRPLRGNFLIALNVRLKTVV